MRNQRVKSAMTSLMTAGGELAILTIASAFFAGPAFLAARWMIGATGSTANFFINRRWAFEAHTGGRTQATRFAVTVVSAVTIASLLWWVALNLSHSDPRIVHVVTMMTVWILFTFPMMKHWVFACAEEEDTIESSEPSRFDE